MSTNKAVALQLCAFSSYLEDALAARVELVRWYELGEAERTRFLGTSAGQCRVVITGGHIGCPFELMERLPSLELIAINGVGFDKVDIGRATSRGVRVTNTPDVLTEDVADLALGLIIALKRKIAAGDDHVRSGRWVEGDIPLGRRVSGSRFGILGFGRIGQAIAERLAPLGEIGYTARGSKQCPHSYFASVSELAEWADVLVVACAATGETARLIDERVLGLLGADGILVNVARGSIVDERALAGALENGIIAGAALDVFANEPEVPEAFRRSGQTLLTPHIGSATVETRRAMADLVLANIDAFLAGKALKTIVE